ncbi:MAG: HAMP domain-containing histidine kinase [Cyclobacteriaceae bacterium]|nr:HAMP domain-containing histidine kinase [Cyclobacteriaceae bacterium]
MVIILFINYYGKYLYGLVAFNLIMPVILLFYVYFFGKIGAENFLFVFALTSVYFLKKHKWLGKLLFLYCLVVIIISKLILWLYLKELTLNNEQIIPYFANIIFVFMVLYFITSLFKENNESEKEKAFDLSETRGKLISMLSHDLRNPIKNLEMLASSSIQDNFTQQDYKKFMSTVSNQLNLAGFSLENTLMWVKRQMNGLQMEFSSFSLNEVLDENLEIMKDFIVRKGLQVEVEIIKNIEIYSDREIINIILRNLLSNAVKHSIPNNGVITISVKDTLEKYWIEVKDTGQGIKKEKLSNIFSDNLSMPGTQNERGYGVGLKLVKSFLEDLGEDIKVESIYEKGSSFSFSISK